jgi:hypothetical protein
MSKKSAMERSVAPMMGSKEAAASRGDRDKAAECSSVLARAASSESAPGRQALSQAVGESTHLSRRATAARVVQERTRRDLVPRPVAHRTGGNVTSKYRSRSQLAKLC